jgi:hypothetical protein
MATNYETDSKLEYKFAKTMKSILGNQFIIKDIRADIKEGTDFLIFQLNPIRVAVRLRRFKYLKYKNDFTIRWSRPSGVKTEFQKIMDRDVDYILYGFIDDKENEIIHYFIGDLDIFRNKNPKPFSIKPNNPPDSELAVFRISDLPASFIIKSYSKTEKINSDIEWTPINKPISTEQLSLF